MSAGLFCESGRLSRHHPDRTSSHCIACKHRLFDTLAGWTTARPQAGKR